MVEESQFTVSEILGLQLWIPFRVLPCPHLIQRERDMESNWFHLESNQEGLGGKNANNSVASSGRSLTILLHVSILHQRLASLR